MNTDHCRSWSWGWPFVFVTIDEGRGINRTKPDSWLVESRATGARNILAYVNHSNNSLIAGENRNFWYLKFSNRIFTDCILYFLVTFWIANFNFGGSAWLDLRTERSFTSLRDHSLIHRLFLGESFVIVVARWVYLHIYENAVKQNHRLDGFISSFVSLKIWSRGKTLK